MSIDATLAVVEQLGFRCSAADVALKTGDDIAACRRRLLTLGSQVDARLEISRTQIAAPRIEPGSVLDPQQYKPAEPARGMKLGSPVSSAASAPAVELSSIGASAEATAFTTTFIFPRNSKELLRARVRSEWIKFAFYSYVWPPLFWLLRFSFAASLVLSILLILVAIIIVIVIACSDRERHDMPSLDGFFGGGGAGGGGGPHVIHYHHGPSFWDWYWTMRLMDMANPPVYYYPAAPNGHVIAVDAFGNPIAVPQEQAAAAGGARQMAASSSSEWDPVVKPDGSGNPSSQPAAPSAAAPPRRNRPDPDDDDDGEGVPLVNNRENAGARETRPMNFVAAVFSWLFGDGAPNSTFEAQQWEAMAEYIRGCGGVVMAAELRPFQIKPLLTPGESDSLDEEAFMLPILSHFDGNASPSACGTFIVYHFPSLTSHAHIRDAAELERADPLQRYTARNKPRPFVLESFWQFSLADSSSLRSVMWLGAFNLILLLLFPFICTAAGVSGQHDLHPTRAPLPPGVTLPPKRSFTIHQDPKTHVFTASFDKVPPVVTATKVGTTQAPVQAPVPPVQAAPTMLFDASTSTVNEPTKAARRRFYRNRFGQRLRRDDSLKSNRELVGNLAIWILSTAQGYYWYLLAYAVMFFAVPYARKRLYDKWNAAIHERNLMRIRRADVLVSVVRRTPDFAQRLRQTRARAALEVASMKEARSQVVYTTRSNRLAEESRHFVAAQASR